MTRLCYISLCFAAFPLASPAENALGPNEAPAYVAKYSSIDQHSRTASHLWTWVRGRMGLDIWSPVPAIVVVPPEELTRIRTRRTMVRPGNLEVLAIYDRGQSRIVLGAPWDPSDPISQSVIVHELVHHAQAMNDRRFACPQEAENEAYRIQADWLRLHGLDLKSSIGLNDMALFLLTHCGM